ncbi:MAG: DUF6064 family protein [Gemmatimonadales bacterium]
MPEWWTYSLSDFLLFSPRTYYRIVERHNAAVWPGQIVTLGLGAVLLWLLWRPTRWRRRVIPAIVAVLWAWVGWAFLWRRYSTINWAATYAAWAFAIEVLWIVCIGVVRGRLVFRPGGSAARVLGGALLVVALTLYPALAPMLGRGWNQAEVFGVMPDPTAIGTLGLLLLAEGRPRWELLVVPVLWCLVGGATMWAMGSPEAWVPALAAILVLGASAWSQIQQGRSAAIATPADA